MISEQLDSAARANQELALEMLQHRNRALREAIDLYTKYVNPEEFLSDTDGELWSRIGLTTFTSEAIAYQTEQELTKIRNKSRDLVLNNEFAINATENRISYVVGEGHIYQVEAENEGGDVDMVRDWLDDWLKANDWYDRQEEIRRRLDRDGEAFLRFFETDNGLLRVRFIEPEAIKTPPSMAGKPGVRFGIAFDPEDAETALTYFVHRSATSQAFDEVDAGQVQHRKANVDRTAARGLPIYYPVDANLRRAEKLLRNLGVMVGVRAAIAWIHKHASGSVTSVQEYTQGKRDVQVIDRTSGTSTDYRRYSPGTERHIPENDTIEYPPAPDFKGYVIALQAELRAVASRLVMPEFMLSSDASNANYSSTMVAEGPAVKMFQRLQRGTIEDDLAVIERARDYAIEQGVIPSSAADMDITAEPPTVQVRDQLKEAQADHILFTDRVLSERTYATRHGLDADEEAENREQEMERDEGFAAQREPQPEPMLPVDQSLFEP